jgi:LacI family transcriptional regulator
MRTPRRADVAELAGVSATTVSYVINERMDVAIPEVTRSRVLSAARELGYSTNRIARALRTGHSNVIALWLPGFCEPHYVDIMYRVQQEARKHGFEIVPSEFGGHTTWSSGLPGPSGWPTDGVLVYDGGAWLQSSAKENQLSRLPIVNMGGELTEGIDCVGVDLRTPSREALRHLYSIGCRHIAYAHADEDRSGDVRWQEYANFADEAGMQTEYVVIAGYSTGYPREIARLSVRDHIEQNGSPDALFCGNDDIAIGAYRGILDLGLRVPDDVALIGCDGIKDVEYLDTPISSIVIPVVEMVSLGWRLLHRRMNNPTLSLQQKMLQAHLVVRESSGGSTWNHDACAKLSDQYCEEGVWAVRDAFSRDRLRMGRHF